MGTREKGPFAKPATEDKQEIAPVGTPTSPKNVGGQSPAKTAKCSHILILIPATLILTR